MNKRTRWNRRRRGAVAVEAALVLPVLFLLMIGIFDFGRVIMTQQLLDNAARAGARQAVVGTSTLTTANIQTVVTNYLAGQTLQNMSIQVYQADPTTGANIGAWTNAATGQCIAVQVSGNYVPIVPKLSMLPNPLPMSSKVVMFSEAN